MARPLLLQFSIKMIVIVIMGCLPVFAASSIDDGIQELVRVISPQALRIGQKKIAVADFADLQGRVTALGRFIADELSAALVLSGRGVRIVDRQHLARIIQEQKLSIHGITDPQSVKEIRTVSGGGRLDRWKRYRLGRFGPYHCKTS